MRTEDDIRAAFRALAKQAPDDDAVLTAVRKQLARASASSDPGVRRPVGRWIAPLAAAAAVIAVTATAVAIADREPHQPGPESNSLLDRLPPYYMTLPGPAYDLTVAGVPSVVVKNTRTGRTLVTAQPPAPYHSFVGITGARNDRTFVLAALPAEHSQETEKLFRARLNPATRTLTMTPLPLPISRRNQLVGMALSPGGTELALALKTGRFQFQFEIRLYSLPGTLLKTWQSNGIPADAWLNPANMSWARAGVLAINWTHYGRKVTPKAIKTVYSSGLWLLNTSAAGGNLAGQSRLVVPSTMMSGFFAWGDGLLSLDGNTAVMAMIRDGVTRSPIDGKIEEFSVATGQRIRTLWPVHFGGRDSPAGYPSEQLMWSNASGSVLVLEANLTSGPRSNGRTAMGVLRGTQFVPIPGAPSTKFMYYGLVF